MSIFNVAITMDIVCAAISMVGSLLVARYDRWSYFAASLSRRFCRRISSSAPC